RERHMQPQAYGRRRRSSEPPIEPEHAGRDESPGIPPRQRPGEGPTPWHSCEVELRGEQADDCRPEQRHAQQDFQRPAVRRPGSDGTGPCLGGWERDRPCRLLSLIFPATSSVIDQWRPAVANAGRASLAAGAVHHLHPPLITLTFR